MEGGNIGADLTNDHKFAKVSSAKIQHSNSPKFILILQRIRLSLHPPKFPFIRYTILILTYYHAFSLCVNIKVDSALLSVLLCTISGIE